MNNKSRAAFNNMVSPILSGVKDVIFHSIWEDVYEEYCREHGFIAIKFIRHNGRTNIFICRDAAAEKKVRVSGIIEARMKGPMSVKDHITLGRLLGFPPKSVTKFAQLDLSQESYIMLVDYCGMTFRSFKDTIIDDITWLLLNRKPVSDRYYELEIQLNKTKLSRDFSDVSILTIRNPMPYKSVLELIETRVLNQLD